MQPITSLIKSTFAHFNANIRTTSIIILVPAIIAGIAAFFEPMENEVMAPSESGVYILLTIVSVVLSMLMTIALIHKVADTSLDAKAAYRIAMRHFLKYLGLVIVLTLILIPAFILLIIPGIWLSIAFSFAMFFLLLKSTTIRGALSASFNLVKGRWWKVFGRTIILGLISLAFVIILEVLSGFLSYGIGVDAAYGLKSALAFILTPFSTAYMYLMFMDMQGGQETPLQ